MTETCKCLHFFAVLAIAAHGAYSIRIRPRSFWDADSPRSSALVPSKVNYVIIHHSDNPQGCSNSAPCKRMIKNIQSDHMGHRNFTDIGYNFIIAGDGSIYEGRGFGIRGSHATGYNRNSIGIAFLGNFNNKTPSSGMLQNAKDLIDYAVQQGYLKDDYKLLGHRQTKATSCPGSQLFNIVKTWPHWSSV